MSALKLCAAAFLGLLVTASGIAQQAQGCGPCPKPVIGLYDFNVTVQQPKADKDIINWLRLFWPARGARNHFVDADSSRSCAIFHDGAMTNASATDGRLRVGPDTVNLPPAGPVKALDYIVSGTVSQSGGVNTATMTLEAAGSREVVATGTATFAIAEGSDDPIQAGRTAAMQASPIADVIRKWEKKKRDEDKNVGIGRALEIKVEPEKKRVAPRETIKVDITLTDCDDAPLAGREISFDEAEFEGMRVPGTTGGKVKPATVTTDTNGKATVTFTPTTQGEPMVIVAHWIHKTPSGHNDAWLGQAPLNLNGYLIDVQGTAEDTADFSSPPGRGFDKLTHRVREQTRFRFIWIPKAVAEDYTVFMTGDAEDGTILAPSVFASRTYFEVHEISSDKFYQRAREERSGQKTDARDLNFLFTLKPGEWFFIMGATVAEKRTLAGIQCMEGTCKSESEATDESDGVGMHATHNDPPGETQLRETKSGWIITRQVLKTTPNPKGLGDIVERSNYTARITRLSDK